MFFYDFLKIKTSRDIVNLIFLKRFRSIVKSYYRDTDCFMLMFDVSCEQSYLNLRNWIATIHV